MEFGNNRNRLEVDNMLRGVLRAQSQRLHQLAEAQRQRQRRRTEEWVFDMSARIRNVQMRPLYMEQKAMESEEKQSAKMERLREKRRQRGLWEKSRMRKEDQWSQVLRQTLHRQKLRQSAKGIGKGKMLLVTRIRSSMSRTRPSKADGVSGGRGKDGGKKSGSKSGGKTGSDASMEAMRMEQQFLLDLYKQEKELNQKHLEETPPGSSTDLGTMRLVPRQPSGPPPDHLLATGTTAKAAMRKVAPAWYPSQGVLPKARPSRPQSKEGGSDDKRIGKRKL